ncbi:pyridoxamine 5'-phosphate oxidase family protein [Sulfitobacter sp. M57]|uniref:pyridoxamine 5'-phosphate oxidase family protein n=1 Tax=unclassified Sulfitobacter TaxID=196795 RepID=UPI0023E233F2|nr:MULTISPECIES: pyridoxamine 5'-phosphate oxidase family protein [unclassified Sulfitobacter]MDF3415704.1 pyridoxamine 5'-phosphate oxidase family protein [Sulfitobacter sp. KE5]MDF3423184.1 pyridoxamine 5'-phosphate oxidase family protein [Sulfitobacter sp. KE43]MDF3434250.1 pyridoxamine 5'-phosphate oxidase family protein [Sulfitobacter sp. KE42]MDF3459717.1 pyridoxamine 5'-phosphate oxidase family protein [Sulfitobacter sp. S74]MDF3463788.1 pyridoxamine 5'-phosphate oxidase family protein 
MTSYADLMFTAAVRAEQDRIGSLGKYDSRYAAKQDEPLGGDEQAFLTSRTSVYIASVNSDGWPYMQHRGGPAGFLKVLDPFTIGFADYLGNRQLITKGNLAGEDRVSVFAMDYARKARLKLQGHAMMQEAEDVPDLVEHMATEGQGRVQRVMTIRVVAWDWNCPQFITPRFDTQEMTALVGPELSRLEDENAALRARLTALEGRR